jgi:hypothetical protein
VSHDEKVAALRKRIAQVHAEDREAERQAAGN